MAYQEYLKLVRRYLRDEYDLKLSPEDKEFVEQHWQQSTTPLECARAYAQYVEA